MFTFYTKMHMQEKKKVSLKEIYLWMLSNMPLYAPIDVKHSEKSLAESIQFLKEFQIQEKILDEIGTSTQWWWFVKNHE